MSESLGQVRQARAGLLGVAEPPASGLSDLVDQLGPVGAWDRVKSGALTGEAAREVAGRVAGLTPDELELNACRALAEADASGARLVVPEDPEWPEPAFHGFRMAARQGVRGAVAPLALWVRGTPLTGLPTTGVALVGSRACTPYGHRIAADLALGLAQEGKTVVSGAAFGVDAAAHRGALAASGDRPTVAVLACGIDRAYPAANAPLIQAIAERGAVVSEYPPGTGPARHRFLVRNRLVAALAAGTVVVEAGRRSGTLSTASAARHLQRVVMAMPGPVTSAMSVGCHHLIQAEQAVLVTGADDVRAQLWPASGADEGSPEDGLFEIGAELALLTPDATRVLDALPVRSRRTVLELAHETAIDTGAVMAALAVLDVFDLAQGGPSGWRRSRRAAGHPGSGTASGRTSARRG